MVQVNNGDGKTKETAIRIICAEDRAEGWEYIRNYIKAQKENLRFEEWKSEYISITETDGFETELVVFRDKDDEIWFDHTWLYLYMR